MKFFFALSTLLFASTSFAQLATGEFTGGVSNNAINDFCQVTQGDLRITDAGNGSFHLVWQETGMWQGLFTGPCENDYDVVLTASTTANQWSAQFNSDADLETGTATLSNGVLQIKADYQGGNARNLMNLTAQFTFSSDQKSIDYSRRQESWSGPDFFANGTLYK
jgi:hypothetical protein